MSPLCPPRCQSLAPPWREGGKTHSRGRLGLLDDRVRTDTHAPLFIGPWLVKGEDNHDQQLTQSQTGEPMSGYAKGEMENPTLVRLGRCCKC